MIVSRGAGLFRRVLTEVGRKKIAQPIRHSGAVGYRAPPPPAAPLFQYLSDATGAFMWWWILWHLFTEYEHITGEFPYPVPSTWTDEELGIPPDDDEALGLLEKTD